ncbi:50S ribosomal protein L24 [Pseudoalteromonas sp. GAB2316C]|uniref:50S ribosomal protein L24 n=1 Tax=Pseudoalteromonas sp. GAB2316C TaxID=3025326 RepID=UPI0023591D3D|nr:50S ribosomal protein L24 [Pseudoalteromonas sp. GAB2316C]MDC9567238.1 50S ribosomal protein L24 [Pseudoalteromonas sp. GAB2316C]
MIVIAGKDKGKRGSVQQVLDNGRLIVAGVNMVKKHVKANPNRGTQGGIVEQEASLNASNVAIWNPKTQKADRVGFRFEDGKKVRFFKSNGETL